MTTQGNLDVVGIGNALVDVLSHEADGFIDEHGLVRGAMTLIDAERAEELYAAMGPGTEMSGGSAANTIAGIASFGGQAGYLGRVADDQLGAVFGHDLRAQGVTYTIKPATDGVPTGRCLIVVTADGQRTMNTFLGSSAFFGPGDVDEDRVVRIETHIPPPGGEQPVAPVAEEAGVAPSRVVAVAIAARVTGTPIPMAKAIRKYSKIRRLCIGAPCPQ